MGKTETKLQIILELTLLATQCTSVPAHVYSPTVMLCISSILIHFLFKNNSWLQKAVHKVVMENFKNLETVKLSCKGHVFSILVSGYSNYIFLLCRYILFKTGSSKKHIFTNGKNYSIVCIDVVS
jgi:hypothetical protein